LPIQLSETPAQYHRPSPRLGEHTRTLLAECGYGEAEIEAMLEAGVVTETAASAATVTEI
ncbi:MAG TPA: CoA transferase, partial [Cupriavidus sp.]|nr:CoA transferase [Cupriavidus sp.]